jgi:hypothetical protein
MRATVLVWLVLLGSLGMATPVSADSCKAIADFTHAFPADDRSTKFKFKFRVESDDCNEYACSGWIHYRIHFEYENGAANTKATLVSYRIPAGQQSREVMAATYPSGATMSIRVRDVEITEVSCTTL